jgi:hypothetical protein
MKVWLNDPNRKAKSEGCPNARAAKTTPFHASASRASTRMLSNLGVLALSFVPATEDAVSAQENATD